MPRVQKLWQEYQPRGVDLFADDPAIGNDEAGFYVGDSPHANTVVRNDRAFGNQFGIFIRHARHILVTDNQLSGNCQGIMVLDDGQPGGAGNTAIIGNSVVDGAMPIDKMKELVAAQRKG